jgi:hypothetical protein
MWPYTPPLKNFLEQIPSCRQKAASQGCPVLRKPCQINSEQIGDINSVTSLQDNGLALS